MNFESDKPQLVVLLSATYCADELNYLQITFVIW